ncbi:Fur family transcriptional regulator [Cellulomonas edaphi]|uniref:Fur family transcriptional regulator n=1 Tax=Cellulomonas edaphi TaxID=3053468 RepID=A0ABT7S8C1_9CELL|nr:Fur family transcriptional regulator [Cellulomons edaphi]MDM7831868.1 Fur family transcriptional regulator [Cellulomons edaphi]
MTGQRVTRQRLAVGALMEDLDDFRSAQQIHALLQERGAEIGLATVYRALSAMAESGEFDVLRTESGESLYRRCERDAHHHHVVCRSCGKTVEIEGPDIEAFVSATARRHGFVDVTHTLELFGTCAACAAAARAEQEGNR